jgi:hypothetical protein
MFYTKELFFKGLSHHAYGVSTPVIASVFLHLRRQAFRHDDVATPVI